MRKPGPGKKTGRPPRVPSTKHTLFLPAQITPKIKAECERRGVTLQALVLEAVVAQLGLTEDLQLIKAA